MRQFVILKDVAEGNESVGEMWVETKVFDGQATLSEVMKWADKDDSELEVYEWALRTKEQNWLDMLSKLMRENGFYTAPTKSVRHTPHVECLIAIGPDHTASIIMDEDALKELKNRTGVV